MEYVFSDKTGTLTCNIMEFKKFSAGNYSYSVDMKKTLASSNQGSSHTSPGLLQQESPKSEVDGANKNSLI